LTEDALLIKANVAEDYKGSQEAQLLICVKPADIETELLIVGNVIKP